MFDRIKEFFSSRKKMFKILIIAAFIAIAIIAKIVDENKIDNEKSRSTSANTSAKTAETEQPKIHIGIGHIVMIIAFTAAYGIDKIIVYRNKLEDEKKYDNHKEK